MWKPADFSAGVSALAALNACMQCRSFLLQMQTTLGFQLDAYAEQRHRPALQAFDK